ncbi:MAG: hypothetical protein FE78DRAFT_32051 [Acidomyces sp. 'richmondensis']|nr:MAG: hypothetical protein FE78DRAFT_32051 [Acidomyces sp. 'richmondensis']
MKTAKTPTPRKSRKRRRQPQIWKKVRIVKNRKKKKEKERLPIGSIFLLGGYVAPDGTFVLQRMRGLIMRVKEQLDKMQEIQRWKRTIDRNTTGPEEVKKERERLNTNRRY